MKENLISYSKFRQSLGNFKHSMMSRFSKSSGHYAVGYGGQTSGASSSSNPPLRKNYEVFLSFSGEDTRYGFCDHLYHRLVDRGILVFRDREDLIVGQDISRLLEAVKASKILVPIISLHYASSKWCLMELVQILKCNRPPDQLVLPIFYKVKPSDVREQKHEFGVEFQRFKTQDGVDSKLVQESERAFKEVASLTIWESNEIADGYEAELVKIVVTRIFNELRNPLLVSDYLVGVEKHVEKIEEMIGAKESSGATFIVIHGMGGIGKTTLAKVLYNKLSGRYESCSFLPNIRESLNLKSMENLQKQVLSDIVGDKSVQDIRHVDEGINLIERSFKGKRILLLLDDVGNKDQLIKLAGKNNWSGSDSIIIVTTRNRAVASVHNLSYELTGLSDDQSYELFTKHAFGRDGSCPSNLEFIARDIVSMTGGLPLALEVIGSLLCGQSKGFWEDTQDKLRKKPNDTVVERLKISYDALTYEQQQIFLDIACLPIAKELKYAFYMWKSCEFYPEEGIERLKSLCLIKIGSQNELVMHDQLRDLGRKIIREEDRWNIGNRSRIWEWEEAMEIVEQKQGTPNVEALFLWCPMPPRDDPDSAFQYTSQQFEGMTNLRFLHMSSVRLTGDFENLFPNLKWLYWFPSYGNGDIMGVKLNPKKLVILHLNGVIITEHWNCWSQMKYLKVLRLYGCDSLITTPDFSALKKLEVLILEFCWGLRRIDSSIGELSKTLKVLNVHGCEKLKELPVEVGKMEELRELVLEDTPITEVPISEGYMTKLEILSINECEQLRCIPDSLSSLVKLQCLDLTYCRSLTRIPQSIGKLKSLNKLCLRKAGVRELPDSIGELCDLESLDVFYTPIKCLPTSIGALTKLSQLTLHECKYLESLPIVPPSLVKLKVETCQTLYAFPDLSNTRNLSKITLRNCSELIEISGLEGAESLVKLEIQSCGKLSRIGDLSHLKMLKELSLRFCGKLSHVEGIEKLTSLIALEIRRCNLTVKFPEISLNRNCESLVIDNQELEEIPGLQEMKSLRLLDISGWNSLKYLPDLTHLANLQKMFVWHCKKLTEIRGLENLRSQCLVHIYGCTALEGSSEEEFGSFENEDESKSDSNYPEGN